MSYSDKRNDDSTVHRMLELTQPTSTWRRPLLAMIQPCFSVFDAHQTLDFLLHVLASAKQTIPNTDQLINQPLPISLNYRLAPIALDVDQWKQFIIALGFELEQPDGCHGISMIDVALSQGVLPVCLDGMVMLLQRVKDLPWNILRMALRLSKEDAVSLTTLVEDNQTDQVMAKVFCSSHPDEMKELGFEFRKRELLRSRTPQTQQLADNLAFFVQSLLAELSTASGVFV